MPIKVDISLDAGHGGNPLSGFWVARKDKLSYRNEPYLYQISERIHPWHTVTEFEHKRHDGHLILVMKALESLHKNGYSSLLGGDKGLGDEERLKDFSVFRKNGATTPDEFL